MLPNCDVKTCYSVVGSLLSLKFTLRNKLYKKQHELNVFLNTSGGIAPLFAISRQPPEIAYAAPILIASLAHHAIIAELRLPAKLNLVFP